MEMFFDNGADAMHKLSNEERFISIFKEKIRRDGSEKLLDYLCSDNCDFFTAPASTRYHGAYPGGLLEHSLNVYDCLCDYLARPRVREVYGVDYSEESIAIAALSTPALSSIHPTHRASVRADIFKQMILSLM